MSAVRTTAKQEVDALLANLPDDSSLEDIQYHQYVLEKIKRGRDAIAAVRASWFRPLRDFRPRSSTPPAHSRSCRR